MAKTVNYGLDNSATTNANTIGAVINDSRLQQFLGFGDNIEAVVAGVVVNRDFELSDGDVVTLRTKAGDKGAHNVIVNYGLDNSITTVAETVGNVLNDSRLQQFLGFGDNVEAVLNGVVVNAAYVLADNDVLALRTRAGDKGSMS